MATQYEAMRKWLLVGGLCALDFALFTVAANCQTLIGNLDDEIAVALRILENGVLDSCGHHDPDSSEK